MKNKNGNKLKAMAPEIRVNKPPRGSRCARLGSLLKRGSATSIGSSVSLDHAMGLGAAGLPESLSPGSVQEFQAIQQTGLMRHGLVLAVGIPGNSERRMAQFLACTTMPLSYE